MSGSLSDDRRVARQDPEAKALGRLYRKLRRQGPDVSLPEFVRLATVLLREVAR